MFAGTNGGPDWSERLDEIAEILSLALMRLQARKSSGKPPHTGESSLDFSAPESGHPTPQSRRVANA
jgi:hypothetical protein